MTQEQKVLIPVEDNIEELNEISNQTKKDILTPKLTTLADIKRIATKIKESVNSYLGYTLPVKLVITSLIGILAGPGLLGFLTEYATYSYSLYYGFRPPLEGIPYLSATIVLVTFLILLICALVFSITQLVLSKIVIPVTTFIWNFVSKIINGSFEKNLIERFKSQNWKIAIIIATIYAITSAIILYLTSIYLGNPKLILSIVCGVYLHVSIVLVWKPTAIWWFAAIATLSVILSLILLIFCPVYYGQFLRFIGYGGGIVVTIEFAENDKDQEREYSSALMLRTSSAIILFDEKQKQIREIPLSEIKSVKHQANHLHKLPFSLPNHNKP